MQIDHRSAEIIATIPITRGAIVDPRSRTTARIVTAARRLERPRSRRNAIAARFQTFKREPARLILNTRRAACRNVATRMTARRTFAASSERNAARLRLSAERYICWKKKKREREKNRTTDLTCVYHNRKCIVWRYPISRNIISRMSRVRGRGSNNTLKLLW